MADKTTGGLPAVRDSAIGDLPGIADLYDDTRIPVEQQGEARSMTGRQWKKYAQSSVSGTAAEAAKEATAVAAAEAAKAAQSAETAREYGEAAVERSKAALEAALEAQSTAASAVTIADNAGDAAAAALDAATAAQRLTESLRDDLSAKADGAYVENGYLYITSGDEVIAGPLGPFSGTGGGTGGGNAGYLVSLKNLLESRVLTVSSGSVMLRMLYSSVDEDGMDDGPGVGTLTVNGAAAATLSVQQGEFAVDVGPYLVSGSNTVKIRVENSEGSSRTISYTVNLISLVMTTTFDPLATYMGAVIFNYTVTGSGTKTVRLLMDGQELGTEEVSSSGRSRSYAIPAQPDGAHVLTVYAEVTAGGSVVRSNTLTVGMMWISQEMTVPAILTGFARESATQGEILTIPYLAYDPLSETAAVTLQVLAEDGTVYSARSLTVSREPQSWTVQDFPAGRVTFRLSCLNAVVDIVVAVEEHVLSVEPVTDALALHFDPAGRSNLEDAPGTWSDGNAAASFRGVGFTGADGWLTDGEGAAVLRILPGGEMTIPFQLFAGDARASGATVEVEMATHNVRDYDTTVLSCLAGGRGFRIASQYAELMSEQSSISMQFKEDEKVRVSFVIEPRNLHRLIFVFVDGILSGAIQYPENDNFAQSPPVGITVGADASGIDVYRIRLYTKGLTRNEVLDNYIADRPLLADRIELAERNDIFDLAEEIVLTKLPPTLPYMVIRCPELPQYKGDKKTCRVEYVNQADPSRSFTAENVQIDVQGTSSAGYKKKNWKLKLPEAYQLRPGSIPAKAFCMKADVASSEGANNVELVRLYNDAVPYRTPPQQEDARVRVGIDGLPCVIFWQNAATGETRFWGKYNFNDEKGSEQVYGLTSGCESWEIRNNTSDRVVFRSADFSGTGWQDDFEARYPDGNTDCSRLAAMCEWVVSTDRGAVSSQEEKDARLAKFKAEFEDHFVKVPMLFYYLFTEVFLMVDSRAKNFFPTTYDGVHWLPLPYDFDTAVGINNEGQLVFDYDLEDTDRVDGSNVFNGQESVLWRNIRDAFADDLRAMYNTLRSGGVFSYAETVRRYSEHQSVWPEAVWNEDAWEKYLEPLEHDGDSAYLTMLQGSKASQREFWLFNGFRYRDSKYQCGDASASFITLRCYNVGSITVTPYSHIWPRIRYGSYTVTQRGKRNTPATLACPLDAMNDTEVYVYSADRLAAIGDLAPLQVGYANFSMAVKLQSLKLGDGAEDYRNTRLTELYVGNNELLTDLDVRNCVNLAQTVDLSGCVGVERVLAGGSAVTGVTLPSGGKLRILELPGTVTNLTVRDQAQFERLDMAGFSALRTLRVENTPNIPLAEIVLAAPELDRVRLTGAEMTVDSEGDLERLIEKLKGCIGLDATGNNVERAVVTGRIYTPAVSGQLLAEIGEAFPELVVVAGGVPQYVVRYVDWNGMLLYQAAVSEGGSAVDPVAAGLIAPPVREGTEDTGYAFRNFGTLPSDVRSNLTLVAQYDVTYRVLFMNDATVYHTQWVKAGGNAAAPSGTPARTATAQYNYTFIGWSRKQNSTAADSTALQTVAAPRTLYAAYTATVRTYTVRFYNGSTLLQTVTGVKYGGSVAYTGTTPVSPDGSAEDYPFEGWNPPPTNIQGNTDCKAVFGSPLEVKEIEDSWDEILAACADGSYATRYKPGNYKPLDLGSEGIINMQIAGKDKTELADGSGNAPLTWIGIELLKNQNRMNSVSARQIYEYPDRPSWAVGSGINANLWTTQTAYCKDSTAKATWTVTAITDGVLTVAYSVGTSNLSSNKMMVRVNGTTVAEDYHSTADTNHDVACNAGDVVTVYAEYTLLTEYNFSGKLRLTSTGDINIEAAVEDAPKRVGTGVYQEGTGGIGGWGKSELREYYNGTLKLMIPETVRNGIKTVKRTQRTYGTKMTNGYSNTTEDDVWIPTRTEMESTYKTVYPDNASRKKKRIGATSSERWLLRDSTQYGSDGPGFSYVDSGGPIGSAYNSNATTMLGVPLCFCT